ncbi:hypothetical protein GQ53DRAFT_593292, partial [Thozetella sp. PMI_491]
RKFGRFDFNRFDHCTSGQASVGGASFGKVDVDCKLLFKKSKWGVLEGDRPAGIIYMDLDFHQPEGYQLVWVTVQVTLDDWGPLDHSQLPQEGTDLALNPWRAHYPVQMTQWFGPQHIVGPERVVRKTERVDLKPSVQVAGIGAGGLGKQYQTSFEVPYRWTFSGHLVRPDSKPPGVNHYRKLEWTLKENDLEPGQANKIHTAFAFEHGGQPFLMKVLVKGGLKKLHHRLSHKVKSKFGPRPNKDEDTPTTLVNSYYGRRRPLDALAHGLRQAMEMENYERRPLELPKPQRATY